MTEHEVFDLPTEEFQNHWQAIDHFIACRPSVDDQIELWEAILQRIESSPLDLSKAHCYFMLGVLMLYTRPSETDGLLYLEQAHQEDRKFASRRFHRMAAYRLLGLVKGFLEHLRARGRPWEKEQLNPGNRHVLFKALLTIYDASSHVGIWTGHTHGAFFRLIKDDSLRLFAGENYYCAAHLAGLWSRDGHSGLTPDDECPLARATIGLLGGVLEAILLAQLSGGDGQTLGWLISRANKAGVIRAGTILGALASFMLYFRNHLHADLSRERTEFFLNISTATGCIAAMDMAINELLDLNVQGEGTDSSTA
jgi:hypothetical protein